MPRYHKLIKPTHIGDMLNLKRAAEGQRVVDVGRFRETKLYWIHIESQMKFRKTDGRLCNSREQRFRLDIASIREADFDISDEDSKPEVSDR